MIMSSYCGVKCESCKVFIATKNSDNSLKHIIAKEWGRLYKRQFTIEEIYCEGCKSNKVFCMCVKCDIRDCNTEKNIHNCSICNVYPCDRMIKFYQYQKEKQTGVEFDDYVKK